MRPAPRKASSTWLSALRKHLLFPPTPTVDSSGIVRLTQRTTFPQGLCGRVADVWVPTTWGSGQGCCSTFHHIQHNPSQQTRGWSQMSAVPWWGNPTPASSGRTLRPVAGWFRPVTDSYGFLQTHGTFRILCMTTGASGCPQALYPHPPLIPVHHFHGPLTLVDARRAHSESLGS